MLARTCSVAVSLLVALCRAQCPPEVFEQIKKEGLENSQVMQHLDHLTNRIGPRLTGSDGCTNACEWAVSKFKEFGIENARMEKWGTFPVGWSRGQWSGEMLAPVQEALVFGTEAWTAGTVGPVEGHAVLEPTNEGELEAVQGSLKGAWIIKRPTPMPQPRGRRPGAGESRPASRPQSRPASRPQSRPEARDLRGPARDSEFSRKLAETYKRAGIAGIVRDTSNIDGGYPLQVRVFGSYRGVKWESLPKDVNVQLRRDQHKKIVDFLTEGMKVRLRFDIRNYFKQGPIDVFNVVADIPGTERYDEYVVAGGHIDSWHQATGTTDNGTGVATTLEAARILCAVGAKPRRTIRFMLWSGEEQGLMGSNAFVKKHRTEMDKYSAAFVHDMGTNYLSGLTVTEDMRESMERVVKPLLDLDSNMKFTLGVTQRMGGGGGSDHASFLSAGVPGFAWRQSGEAVYGRTWHSQWDTYDAAIPAYQRHSSVVIATTTLGVANLPEVLPRVRVDGGGGLGGGGGGFAELAGAEMDGLKFTKVEDSGWAKEAGFRSGDELVSIDGEALEGRRGLARLFGTEEGEQAAKVVVKRDGKDVEMTVKRLRFQLR
jgi:carboxypeptidase Q